MCLQQKDLKHLERLSLCFIAYNLASVGIPFGFAQPPCFLLTELSCSPCASLVVGKSKGYAFCEFADESISDTVIRSLHMKRLGNKSLTVKRALEGGGGGGSITGMRSGGSGSGGGGGAMLGTSPLATSGSGQLASFGSGPYGLQHGGGSGSPTGTQGGAGALLAKLVGYPSASMPMSMSMQGGGHSQYQPSPTGAGPSMGGQDSPADLQGGM